VIRYTAHETKNNDKDVTKGLCFTLNLRLVEREVVERDDDDVFYLFFKKQKSTGRDQDVTRKSQEREQRTLLCQSQ
jgi:hypothetical protein